MTDMIAAEPALAARIVARLRRSGRPGRRAGTGRHAGSRRWQAGRRHRLRHVRARRAGRSRRIIGNRRHRRSRHSSCRSRPPTEGSSSACRTRERRPRRMRRSRPPGPPGARTALITVSGRSPGAALADIVVETEELDQGWCHTVGYVSPIVAGAVVAAHAAGRPVDGAFGAALRGALTMAPSEAEQADRWPGPRSDPRGPRRRIRRRSADRSRARPQDRGGPLDAVGLPRPRDVPPRPPRGDRTRRPVWSSSCPIAAARASGSHARVAPSRRHA